MDVRRALPSLRCFMIIFVCVTVIMVVVAVVNVLYVLS